MKIGRKEVALSTVQYITTTISSIIAMSVVLSNVSTEEYAIWNVFLSIEAFVVLIDSGFGGVVLRYTSYAMSGVKSISKEGLSEAKATGEVNYYLLSEIIYCARKIYQKFAGLGYLILVVCSAYIYYLSREQENVKKIIVAWIVFSIVVAIDMYYTYLSNVMKGMGKIKETSIIGITIAIFSAVIKIITVSVGLGLIGLVYVALNRALLYFFMRKDLKFFNKKEVKAKKLFDINSSSVYSAIMKNSKQLTWVTVSDFVTGKGKTLVSSAFLSLSVLGKFSVSNQLIGIVYSFASLPYSVFRFKFGESIPRKDNETTKNVFSMIILFLIVIMFIGTGACVVLGDFALNLIGSETSLLNDKDLILLATYQLIIGVLKICTVYIQYNNTQPYVKSIVLASILSIFIPIPFMMLGGGITIYLLVLIIIQLVYNLWKWVFYSYNLLNMPIHETLNRGIKYFITVAKGSR